MKIGYRKPSLKKSIKARTTGKVKRQVKSAVNPLYGKKGMGLINNPKKAVYNKVYNKTTVSATKTFKTSTSPKAQAKTLTSKKNQKVNKKSPKIYPASQYKFPLFLLVLVGLIWLITVPFLGIVFLIWAYFIYKNKIKNNPYKTSKDIPEELKTLKLSKTEIQNLISKLQNNLDRVENHQKVLESTIKPEKFSESIKSVYDLVDESYKIMFDLSRTPNFSADGLTDGLDEIKSAKAGLEEDFIKRYYFDNIKHANSLKTEKGKENNIANGKARLLEFSKDFEETNKELIQTLYDTRWSRSGFI
ncbi:hypothetical protein [Streptococcus hyovaginalis]|uniref:hypothetical protein n=1 Tax=Streptococcus hyovaginalis TaxID=149015 RepID=UPI003BF7E93C